MRDANGNAVLRQALERHCLAHEGQDPVCISLAETRALAREAGVSARAAELAALRAQVAPERYKRNLGTAGWEGQVRLLEACVAIVGVGGLGGWIAEGLARMGVGRLLLVDGDRFSEDNLNRQLGCTEETLGRRKVDVLAARLATVNSAVDVVPHAAFLDEANAASLLEGAQVVVDALDTLTARFVLHRVASGLDLPLVHGAIGGYTGQVMTLLPGDPGLRALYGDIVPERGVETVLGNPSATPMMIAAWQIQEVVKLIVGRGQLIRGRLLLLDAESGSASEIELG